MSYGTNGLTFNTLRGANTARLPQFKNKHGGQAHSKPDGSDWAPAQWLEALVGEVGEFAFERLRYELGLITFDEYQVMAAKELADIQTYLDIMAKRCLDKVDMSEVHGSPTGWLMLLVAQLGEHANAHKKLVRGDITNEQFFALSTTALMQAEDALSKLRRQATYRMDSAAVTEAHPTGVDLGQATINKFNEVSERVGSTVRLAADDWHDVGAKAA